MLSRYRSGFLLMPLAALSLLAALWAGLSRLGWNLIISSEQRLYHKTKPLRLPLASRF